LSLRASAFLAQEMGDNFDKMIVQKKRADGQNGSLMYHYIEELNLSPNLQIFPRFRLVLSSQKASRNPKPPPLLSEYNGSTSRTVSCRHGWNTNGDVYSVQREMVRDGGPSEMPDGFSVPNNRLIFKPLWSQASRSLNSQPPTATFLTP
jgi:hypothetical protein